MKTKRMKKRIFAGTTCDQIVFNTSARSNSKKEAQPRFKNEEERAEHRKKIALSHCIRLVNANFTPAGFYCTLTFDNDHEVYNFKDARKERANFVRRIKYKNSDAKLMVFMGRGESTARIHFHIFAENVTPGEIINAWDAGSVIEVKQLREHNFSPDGEDLGTDFTAVTTYCFNHWTPEQGGHYYSRTKNFIMPEEEEPTECQREYSEDKPPVPPKGFKFVSCVCTNYGYQCFHYVKIPRQGAGRKRQTAFKLIGN